MVRISTICRTTQDYERETKHDLTKVQRSLNPNLHPFQKAREYQRAVIAAKMDKMFAQPFVAAMPNHSDGISCFAKSFKSLQNFISGSWDGEVKLWDLSQKKELLTINAHDRFIKGVCFTNTGKQFLTTDATTINLFNYHQTLETATLTRSTRDIQPLSKFLSKYQITAIDHRFDQSHFVTSGEMVQIWNTERNSPMQQFDWGSDTVMTARFNPVETNLIACTSMDRGVFIYDIRGKTCLQKTVLMNKSACLAWNPMEPVNLTVGNEDGNAYTLDMRKFDEVKMIHKDHINAILSIDYAPTGKEFVTGSFDKCIRIWDNGRGKSKHCYHTKRMQKIGAVAWTMDNQYVLSGSEDANIRIWKSDPSRKVGVVGDRERRKIDLRAGLQEKFKHNRQIKDLKKAHMPKYINSDKHMKHVMRQSKHRKLRNVEMNNTAEFEQPLPERKAKVVKLME
jgi:WD repeat and SOF domain-containing protein 1